MTHDSTNQHLSLEPDYDGFDPLEDFEDDATEVEGRADEFVATVSAAEDALAHDAMAPATPAICEKPAEERIADLLEAIVRHHHAWVVFVSKESPAVRWQSCV